VQIPQTHQHIFALYQISLLKAKRFFRKLQVQILHLAPGKAIISDVSLSSLSPGALPKSLTQW
jgi:hypothetical protein